MAIDNLCNKNVETITANAGLIDAAKIMTKKHVGCLVVTEDFQAEKIPCGIITDRDITKALSSSGSDIDKVYVEDIMMRTPVCAHRNDGVFELLIKMSEHGVKRVPVVNENGALFGIISANDLMWLLSQEITNLSKIFKKQKEREQGLRTPVNKSSSMYFN